MRSGLRRADRTTVTGSFFLTGVVTVLLGPIIPELRAAWDVSHAQAAALFPAQFVASSLGATLSGFHLRRSLVAGYALVAVGLGGLATGGWALAVPSMAATGLGLGLVIAGSNLWTAHRHPTRRASTLATLNLVWGLGAVTCPLLFTAVRGLLPLAAALGLLSGLAAVAALAVWRSVDRRGAAGDDLPPAGGAAEERAEARARPLFLGATALTLFLYVGSENAVGGWLITLADELAGHDALVSLLIGSGFWGAILAGRAAAPWILRRIDEDRLYTACLALAGAGTLALVTSRSTATVAAAAVAAGLGMAPIFPLAVSRLAAATASTHSRRSGWVLAFGGLGGAALPWLTGQATSAWGSLHLGLLVPLAGIGLLATLHGARDALAPR